MIRPLAPLALLAACSGGGDGPDTPTKTDETVDTGSSPYTTPPFDPVIETTDNGDGTFTTLVQATHGEEWVYLSLGAGGVRVDPATPEDSTEWDLKFRRDKIYLNGGVSGTGGGEALALDGVALDSIAWPAAGGYEADIADIDGDDYPEGPFSCWFLYDITSHTLSAADRSFVLRGPSGTFRLRLLSYYHPTGGQSGWPSFAWAPLDEAGPLTGTPDALRLDTTGPDPVYLSLVGPIALRPADPALSTEWDLAALPLALPTNGGVSGSGGRTAAALDQPFDDVTEPPPEGAFAEDAPDADADGVPEYAISGWFSDSGSGPEIVPARTFVIRSGANDTKLAVTSVDAAGIDLRIEPWIPEDESGSVACSQAGAR